MLYGLRILVNAARPLIARRSGSVLRAMFSALLATLRLLRLFPCLVGRMLRGRGVQNTSILGAEICKALLRAHGVESSLGHFSLEPVRLPDAGSILLSFDQPMLFLCYPFLALSVNWNIFMLPCW